MCSLRNIVVLSILGIPRFDHLSLVSMYYSVGSRGRVDLHDSRTDRGTV